MCHSKSINSLWNVAYADDEIYITIFINNKTLLHFKFLWLGQTLHVDKIAFLRTGHIMCLVTALLGSIKF